MRKFHELILGASLLCFVFISSGCAVLAIGAGAAGGYAISKDEVEGFSDRKYAVVWDAG